MFRCIYLQKSSLRIRSKIFLWLGQWPLSSFTGHLWRKWSPNPIWVSHGPLPHACWGLFGPKLPLVDEASSFRISLVRPRVEFYCLGEVRLTEQKSCKAMPPGDKNGSHKLERMRSWGQILAHGDAKVCQTLARVQTMWLRCWTCDRTRVTCRRCFRLASLRSVWPVDCHKKMCFKAAA